MTKHHVRKAMILSGIQFEIKDQSNDKGSKRKWRGLCETTEDRKTSKIVKPTFSTTTVE